MWKAAALVLAALFAVVPAHAQRLKLSVPLDQLEATARADSNDATAHYNLALGYWSKKRWEDAERALDQCLALEPRFALAHLARAYLPFARRPKLWDQILDDKIPTADLPLVQQMNRDYRRAFFFNPMVDLRIVGAVTPAKSWVWEAYPYLSAVYDQWVRAFEDFQNADYANAYRRFDRMAESFTATGKRTLERTPVHILWYQGLAAAQLGMFEEAIANLTEVLRRTEEAEREREEDEERLAYSPMGANEYRYVLGVLMLRAGQHHQGRELLRTAVQNDLGLYMAHVNAAASLEQQNLWEEAVTERRSALAANPEDPTSAMELAITLSRVGSSGEVESLLEETARTNPRNARAWYLLGLTQQQLGKVEQARAALEHFISIAPSRGAPQVADAKRRLAEL